MKTNISITKINNGWQWLVHVDGQPIGFGSASDLDTAYLAARDKYFEYMEK